VLGGLTAIHRRKARIHPAVSGSLKSSDMTKSCRRNNPTRKEVARIANLSIALGYKLEDEDRILTKDEAYEQTSHSASLFKAILGYLGH
jgi:hypothetical protein